MSPRRCWLVCGALALASLLSPSLAMAVELPPALVGIWTKGDSSLRGELVLRGEVLYLDTDGSGAITGSDGVHEVKLPLRVSTFDAATLSLTVEVQEDGRALPMGTLQLDAARGVLLMPQEPDTVYQRRAATIAPATRQALGLKPKAR